jgi:hypothetical protein
MRFPSLVRNDEACQIGVPSGTKVSDRIGGAAVPPKETYFVFLLAFSPYVRQ